MKILRHLLLGFNPKKKKKNEAQWSKLEFQFKTDKWELRSTIMLSELERQELLWKFLKLSELDQVKK